MSSQEFETLAIRTQNTKSQEREHSVPLFLTSSFTFESAEQGASIFKGEEEGNLYSRFSNPNVNELVDKLCLLEKCQAGIATASGMAAVYTTLVALLEQGDHLIASSSIFGNSRYIIEQILPKMGVDYTFVEVNDNHSFETALQSNTKMVFLETPSNPTLKIADLTFLGNWCKANDILLAVDNCFATPYLQKPRNFGAHLVIHSATKYIDGQGRVLGGVILGDKKEIDICFEFLRRTGSSLSPFNAWVLSKSLETLAVRMDKHCSNAEALVEFLASSDEIEKVIYPGLSNHPEYHLAQQQMMLGGGLVGCIIKGGAERGAAFLNALEMHSLTANLGDTRSIATHPASTTHSRLSTSEQRELDIMPGYLRFSVGLEHPNDILKDIEQAILKTKL